MANLFADEDFPFPVVRALRRLGHDVVTVRDRGLDGIRFPDPVLLLLATVERRAVLTMNRGHFFRMHAADPAHAGIIACKHDKDFAALAARIDAALAALPDLTGQLVRVNRPSVQHPPPPPPP